MENHNYILNELREWGSPLADMPRVMPFLVPEGYFERFTGHTQNKIQYITADEPILNWSKKLPFDVPKGYFDTFPDKLLLRISGQLNKLHETHPFEVPAGYFDKLPQQVLQAAKNAGDTGNRKSKTIPFGSAFLQKARLAAAAILIMGIGIGSYTMLTSKPMRTEAQLAALSKPAINDYIDQNIDDFDSDMIVNALAANDAPAVNDLKEDEIIQYLNENGWEQNVN